MRMIPEIRAMTPADIPAGMHLKDGGGGNPAEEGLGPISRGQSEGMFCSRVEWKSRRHSYHHHPRRLLGVDRHGPGGPGTPRERNRDYLARESHRLSRFEENSVRKTRCHAPGPAPL